MKTLDSKASLAGSQSPALPALVALNRTLAFAHEIMDKEACDECPDPIGDAMDCLRAAVAQGKRAEKERAKMLAALAAFVECIDTTGGVTEHTGELDGGPAADPEWLDLGDAYRKARAILARNLATL